MKKMSAEARRQKSEYMKKYMSRPEVQAKQKEYMKKYMSKPDVKARHKASMQKYQKNHPEVFANAYKKWASGKDGYAHLLKKHRNLRLEVLTHYGARCNHCGCRDIDVLCIDHVNHDGWKHRRTMQGSIYQWLKTNIYPDGFQVLCHNCNAIKQYAAGYAVQKIHKHISGIAALKCKHPKGDFETLREYGVRMDGYITTNKASYARRRLQAMQQYGGAICKVCGITDFRVLCFDHIDGGGNAHLRSIGGPGRLLSWLRKNNYPKGFQILCHNCNYRKRFTQ